MKANNSEVFLVNTGWNGKGERISLKNTRLIIDSILNDELDDVGFQTIPIFNLKVPTKIKKIPRELLDPRSTWSSNEAWDKKANELAKLFINNFEKFWVPRTPPAAKSKGESLSSLYILNIL